MNHPLTHPEATRAGAEASPGVMAAETRLDNWLQATFESTHPAMQAWAVIRHQLEAQRLSTEDEPLAAAFTFDKGLDAARRGVQELTAAFDDAPFEGCPEAWMEKPIARIRWHEDGGDRGAGIAAVAGWVLAEDQRGTVLQDLLTNNSATGTEDGSAVQDVWTRSGQPVLDGPPSRWGVPFARITRFQSASGTPREGWALAADQRGTMIEPLLVDVADRQGAPNPEQLLADRVTPGWLAAALRSALDRDPVKAANEAAVLSLLLSKRADQVLIAAQRALSAQPGIGFSPI